TFSLSLPPFTKAVKWLVLINAGVYLLIEILKAIEPQFGEPVQLLLSLIPIMVLHGWITQLVTYSFVHVTFWHILGNMLWLWWFGAALEAEWGKKRFLEFYFFCVVGAALVTIAVSFTGFGGVTLQTPTAGASGGVLGILMAFGLLFGNQDVMLFPIPLS